MECVGRKPLVMRVEEECAPLVVQVMGRESDPLERSHCDFITAYPRNESPAHRLMTPISDLHHEHEEVGFPNVASGAASGWHRE